VSSLNTVVTYDLVQPYLAKDRDDRYYLNVGRWVTVGGIILGAAAGLLAQDFNNIMNYLQTLFSVFNAPIFATFILGMFWTRTTKWGGFWGLLAGVLSGATTFLLYETKVIHFGSDLAASFAQAAVAFGVDFILTIVISLCSEAPDLSKLRGLVYHVPDPDAKPVKVSAADRKWYRRPILLGSGSLVLVIVLDVLFA
jgi:SSS family solute:Na+ symporter